VWGGDDFQRGLLIGGSAPRVVVWLWPLLRQMIVAACTAIAAALGKELFERYVNQNFAGRRKRRD
jgi:hypothetical protein